MRGGKLVFDVGWVGSVESSSSVDDGKWHAIAVSYDAKSGSTTLYVDGRKEGASKLLSQDDDDHVFRLGYTATNFAAPLKGSIDDIRFFQRKLSDEEVALLAGGVQITPQLSGIAISGSTKENVLIENGKVRLKIPAKSKAVKVAFFSGNETAKVDFEKQFSENKAIESLKKFTTGGPTNYPQTIVTVGKKAPDDSAYVTDDLTLPHDNPWNSWMRIGGFDFYSDPTKAALCTWSGDVWTVSGIDGNFEKLIWRRIATGMFQPLGLKIINDEIFVGCRDQITKLVDLNGDGETDFYQTFNNDHQVTEHFHEFAMDLQTDPAGNFYYAKSARHALDSVCPTSRHPNSSFKRWLKIRNRLQWFFVLQMVSDLGQMVKWRPAIKRGTGRRQTELTWSQKTASTATCIRITAVKNQPVTIHRLFGFRKMLIARRRHNCGAPVKNGDRFTERSSALLMEPANYGM